MQVDLIHTRSHSYQDIVEYVQNLIKLRKAHNVFKISNGSDCEKCLRFIDNKKAGLPEQVLAWEIDGTKCGDTWKKAVIIANPYTSDAKFELNGKGNWICVTDGKQFVQNPENMSDGTVVTVSSKAVAVFALL